MVSKLYFKMFRVGNVRTCAAEIWMTKLSDVILTLENGPTGDLGRHAPHHVVVERLTELELTLARMNTRNKG